jgi:ABC-type lipoprotein export system ATPase subunit
VRELSEQYGLEIDPTAEVDDLPVGLQQRVEIIKALYRHADIFILDEPTAVLTPQESNELFRIMRESDRARRVDHLHHPQAEGSAGRGRPHRRLARRPQVGTADPKPSRPKPAWPN